MTKAQATELREGIASLNISEEMAEKPIAEILFCCGFFLSYLIEESIHYFLDAKVHHHHAQSINVHRTFSVQSKACEAGTSEKTKCSVPKTSSQQQRRHTVCANNNSNGASSSNTAGYNTFTDEENGNGVVLNGGSGSDLHGVVTMSSVRDFLTMLALSFHAVFEGLAVGLEKDVHDVWTLFGAIASHKYVIAFCVSLELFQAGTKRALHIAYLLVFSLISPVGILIGHLITSVSDESDSSYTWTVAVLQALAGGTIIYVVVFEVLQRERSKNVSGLVQLAFIILGFSCMMFIELFSGHSHSHGGDDHDHGDHDHDDDHDHEERFYGSFIN